MIDISVEANKNYIKGSKVIPRNKRKIGLVFYKKNARVPCMITSEVRRLDLETGRLKSHFHYTYLSKIRYITSEKRLTSGYISREFYETTWGKFLPDVILEAVEEDLS